jgi:hypothetical protein
MTNFRFKSFLDRFENEGDEDIGLFLEKVIEAGIFSDEELRKILEILVQNGLFITKRTLLNIALSYQEEQQREDYNEEYKGQIKENNSKLLNDIIFRQTHINKQLLKFNSLDVSSMPVADALYVNTKQENEETTVQMPHGDDIDKYISLKVLASEIVQDGKITDQEVQEFAQKASMLVGKITFKESLQYLQHFAALKGVSAGREM